MVKNLLIQLVDFTYRQILCCIFPAAIFLILALSKVNPIQSIPRYDFIFVLCVAMQIFMVQSKLETMEELKTICLFHLIGLFLEIYKVKMGSWSYPEFSYLKIAGIPIYSGFMYASVASYVGQAFKRFDLLFEDWPGRYLTLPLAGAIYINFFTNHFFPDLRILIFMVMILIFSKTTVRFTSKNTSFQMPLVISFVFIGFFIWIAENISTFFGAWQYPNQRGKWHLVDMNKISSWILLVIISIILIYNLNERIYRNQKKSVLVKNE